MVDQVKNAYIPWDPDSEDIMLSTNSEAGSKDEVEVWFDDDDHGERELRRELLAEVWTSSSRGRWRPSRRACSSDWPSAITLCPIRPLWPDNCSS